jgi:hypothetical protein
MLRRDGKPKRRHVHHLCCGLLRLWMLRHGKKKMLMNRREGLLLLRGNCRKCCGLQMAER